MNCIVFLCCPQFVTRLVTPTLVAPNVTQYKSLWAFNRMKERRVDHDCVRPVIPTFGSSSRLTISVTGSGFMDAIMKFLAEGHGEYGYRYVQDGGTLSFFNDLIGQGHCVEGCPIGPIQSNISIKRPIYEMSFNTKTKFADWVGYKVNSIVKKIKLSKRNK